MASMMHTVCPFEILSPTEMKGGESGFAERKKVPIIGDFMSAVFLTTPAGFSCLGAGAGAAAAMGAACMVTMGGAEDFITF